MHLIKVIPATKIPLNNPQILTYFTARELKAGGLVLAPLHKRKVIGVVESIEKIHGQKMSLRKAEFELRGIAKVISPEQVIDKKQFQLAKWISEYYWCSIGSIIKTMIPSSLLSLRTKRSNFSELHRAPAREIKHNAQYQTLILTPEISFIEKLAKQNKITDYATLRSDLTDKQYYENWLRIKNNEAKNIIATRAALFAPFQNLKKIIMEDEHNDLYKSQQTPRYHAREVVIKLAELWGAKLTFKSATPSIETLWLEEVKKIKLEKPLPLLPLDKGRVGVGSAMRCDIIDMRQELKHGNFSIFSRALQEKIRSAINKKQQIILFINRRGSSTALLCRDCGYVPKCPNCDVPLSYHLSPIKFLCHRCNYQEIPPVLCPNCLGARIKFFGAGTQKVEAEFKKLFPETAVARLDSDVAKNAQTTGGQTSRGRSDLQNIDQSIINFKNKKIQILIGTQIIFNKNLPKTPLIAMMIADTILHLPDFRSNERTFQIINQLKTMANKKFILQTYSPENSAIQFAIKNDFKSFYQEEIQNRKELNYPPFSQLIKLVYQHASAKKTEEQAKILAEKIKQQIIVINQTARFARCNCSAIKQRLRSNSVLPITILGPSPAFISKVKGKYIWQIILKSRISDIKIRNQILQIIPPDWIVDVDPIQII